MTRNATWGAGGLLYSCWNVSFGDKSAGSWTWAAWACWVGKKRGKGFFPNPRLPLALWTPKSSPWGVCVCTCVYARLVTQSCLTLCDPVDCSLPGSSVHGILLHGIFPIQASNPGLLHWKRILHHLSHRGSQAPKGCSTVAPPQADSCPGCGLSAAPSGQAHAVSVPSRLQPRLKSPPLCWREQQILGFCCVPGNSTNYYFARFKKEEASTDRWTYLFQEADQRETWNTGSLVSDP